MKNRIPENLLLSPFFVFFLIHGSQVGSGILSFQRDLAEKAGYDAWISVILAGLSIHVILWMMYRILAANQYDVIDINKLCFGNVIGSLLNACIIVYFFSWPLSYSGVMWKLSKSGCFPL